MSTDIKIEKVTSKNFEEFFKLFSKLVKTQFPEYSDKTTDWIIQNPRGHNEKRMRKEIRDNSVFVLGAYSQNDIVGFLYGFLPWGGVSIVYWLAIDPKFQRKGIGSALLKEWEEIIKKYGAHAIHLNSDKRNFEFYEKLGYKVIGLHKKSYFGADDYVLSKLIQEPKEENFLR